MTDDLFRNDRKHNRGEDYEQTRRMREPLMVDKGFYEPLLQAVYEAGPRGMKMRALINLGKQKGWWQDTADKHFGEKMRAAWAYGLLVIPDYPGADGTDRKTVLHAHFFDVTFQNKWLTESWDQLLHALGTMNFVDRKKDD